LTKCVIHGYVHRCETDIYTLNTQTYCFHHNHITIITLHTVESTPPVLY